MNNQLRTTNSPVEPAEPCPVCRCPTFWRSAYGGELRCAVCDEWPSLAMVGERWTLYRVAEGRYVWVRPPRRGERPVILDEAGAITELES